MTRIGKRLLAGLLCSMSTLIYANNNIPPDSTYNYEPKPYLGVTVGTMGVGLQFSYPILKRWDVRAVGSYFMYVKKMSTKIGTNDVERTDSITVGGGGLIFDFSLFKRKPGIKIAMGAYYNVNRVSDYRKVTGYWDDKTSFDAGAVWLNMTTMKINPYAGIVFGNFKTKKRMVFAVELGTLFQGKPKVDFVGFGRLEPMSDQEEIVQGNANDYQWFPVANISLNFKLGKL